MRRGTGGRNGLTEGEASQGIMSRRGTLFARTTTALLWVKMGEMGLWALDSTRAHRPERCAPNIVYYFGRGGESARLCFFCLDSLQKSVCMKGGVVGASQKTGIKGRGGALVRKRGPICPRARNSDPKQKEQLNVANTSFVPV